MGILIKNGTVVTAEKTFASDVLIEGGTIKEVRPGIPADAVHEVLDATGMLLLPGGIDAHTHLDMPFGGTTSSDDFETGTLAAAYGGTTSIVEFRIQKKGRALRAGIDTWHAKAEGKAAVDYGFHLIMTDVNEQTSAEMQKAVDEGITSFKLFMAYPGVLMVDDGQIL